MPQRIRLTDGGNDLVAEISDGAVRLAGSRATFAVASEGDGRFTARTDGRSLTGCAVATGGTIWVSVDGAVFEFRVGRAGGEHGASSDDVLTPPMAATVVRIAVSPGQAVAEGDLLVALEAMKMEWSIRAPRDGTIRAVHCHEGELVQPGTRLVEM